MVLSPHTALFATCTVWDQRWNHPIVCTDTSPTTKSVGLSHVQVTDGGSHALLQCPVKKWCRAVERLPSQRGRDTRTGVRGAMMTPVLHGPSCDGTALAAGSTARGADAHGSWRRPTPVRRLPSNNPSWRGP